MSVTSGTYDYVHVLTETEVCDRATARLDHFVEHGGEPAGLDYRNFVEEALQMHVTALVKAAQALHLDLDAPRWTVTTEGAANVVLPFHRSVDPILFRIAVL